MNDQGTMPLFDHAESQRRKRRGKALAADSDLRHEALLRAREYAKELCATHGETHADAVAKAMPPALAAELGPAAGAIFSTREWEWTGKWHTSERVSNHGRLQRIWRLRHA